MARLLNLIWKLFSLLGLVLSLRRWWRTLVDQDEKKETRILAGVILAAVVGLIVWSAVGPNRVASPQHEVAALPAPALPATTEIVVDFRDEVSLTAIDALDDRLGIELRPNSPVAVGHRLMVADVALLRPEARSAVLARLRQDPRVEAADENFSMAILGAPAPSFEPDDPRYPEQWNFRAIGMPQAWEKATGKGAVVAVIDTGVAFEPEGGVPAASDLKQTAYTKPYDFIKNKAKAYDDHGHGTHVAGTIAQSTNNHHGVAGIAYEATIMPLKVLTSFGSGNIADIADAIRYAADQGAQVINMSLGGPRGTAVLGQACRYAYQHNVVIVAAAGNTGGEGVSYPAAYPECIAVSAVGPSGDLTFYSTWGKEIAIAAPGGEYRNPEERVNGVLQNTVFKAQDAFEYWQGTSMASPHVAGVAALLVGKGYKGPASIRAKLRESATPKGDSAKYGAGLLNAAKAVGAESSGSLVAGVAPAPRWLVTGATSVLWPLMVVLTLFGVRPLRPWLGAGCWAFASGCLYLALGGAANPLWLLANALSAGALGRLVLRRER